MAQKVEEVKKERERSREGKTHLIFYLIKGIRMGRVRKEKKEREKEKEKRERRKMSLNPKIKLK